MRADSFDDAEIIRHDRRLRLWIFLPAIALGIAAGVAFAFVVVRSGGGGGTRNTIILAAALGPFAASMLLASGLYRVACRRAGIPVGRVNWAAWGLSIALGLGLSLLFGFWLTGD